MTVSPVISAIMFASGVAALLFETLWFRQAGLSFGNSVWASSLILSSFMAGLALGNGLVAKRGDQVRHPIRLYAVLEVSIALERRFPGLGAPWSRGVARADLAAPPAPSRGSSIHSAC